MGLDYVDIFYHHRPDPDTPLEESMGALEQIVRSGKALDVGISNYGPEATAEAVRILRETRTPFIIHQFRYNLFDRTYEQNGLLELLTREGIGGIVFSPLAHGLLTDRYLNGIPADSRAGHDPRYLKPEMITPEKLRKVKKLNEMACARGQSLAQMALRWELRDPVVTSALIGASRPEQILENLRAFDAPELSEAEIARIDEILNS